MTEAPPPGWEGILRPGETILWQGRPDQGMQFTKGLMSIPVGLFFAGFALFWMSKAFEMTYAKGFPVALMPLFGLLFVYQGLGMAGGFALWDAHRRSRTWYTLSDRRTFIAGSILGQKSLKSWEIAKFSEVEYDYGPPSAVWFARAGGKSGRIGFSHLDDAHIVHKLIRAQMDGLST